MNYLHNMIRVQNLDSALYFFINKLGRKVVIVKEVPKGEFTFVFLGADGNNSQPELTYKWDRVISYRCGNNFGHVASSVENIYEFCEMLENKGVTTLRSPRNRNMSFIRSPDQISIELLQQCEPLPFQEPWAYMENKGKW